MRYKKFLLIPMILFVLIFLYVNFINSLAYHETTVSQSSSAAKSPGAEVIGIGQAVSVQVIRATKPYLFGLVRLPTYAQGIGSLSTLNTMFFWSLYAMTAILTGFFIIIERRGSSMVKTQWGKPAGGDNAIWIKLGKALGLGALFAIVTFLISGDSSSLPLGLLVAYLEFRMG